MARADHPTAVLFPESTPDLVARCSFPAPGSELACAVSGGPDSMTLLALGVARGCRVTAYHVDHHLREGSDKEARLVEAAASRLGAEFVGLQVVVEPGPNLEARARTLRYSVLPRPVATGHTADDQAETILLNLLRGSGPVGLAGMAPGLSHPLLSLRRKETVGYASSLGFPLVDDKSNRDPRFRRNRVRHELLPLVSEIAGRDVVPILCRQAELFRSESEVLDEMAALIDSADIRALRAAPRPVARRALRRWLAPHLPGGYPPGLAAVERVLRVVDLDVRAAELPGKVRVRRSKGRLHLDDWPPAAGSKGEGDDD